MIEAADIVSVAVLTPEGEQPLAGPALTKAAGVIGALKAAPPVASGSVNWGSATLLRITTREGVVLSMQAKPIVGGGAVRVTADTSSKAEPAAHDAAAIRSLRLTAYRLTPEGLAALRQQSEPVSDIELNASTFR